MVGMRSWVVFNKGGGLSGMAWTGMAGGTAGGTAGGGTEGTPLFSLSLAS